MISNEIWFVIIFKKIIMKLKNQLEKEHKATWIIWEQKPGKTR